MTVIRAPAKINLNLLVTGRRKDGMHLIDSLAVFADLTDVLTITPDGRDSLSITGPMAAGLSTGEDNLIMRACRRYREAAGWKQPLRISLEKNIPVAAGLGGGSADAAALLNAVNEMAGARLNASELARLALDLGADIPLCLHSSDAAAWRVRGIGENIMPVSLPLAPGLVLIHSGTGVATADVFKSMADAAAAAATATAAATTMRDEFDAAPEYPPALDTAAFLELLEKGNSLLPAAMRVSPGIEAAAGMISDLAGRSGAIHHGMSGSGAAFFAVFETAAAAKQAVSGNEVPCWHWAGGLFKPDKVN